MEAGLTGEATIGRLLASRGWEAATKRIDAASSEVAVPTGPSPSSHGEIDNQLETARCSILR